jgi:hypothetical protein
LLSRRLGAELFVAIVVLGFFDRSEADTTAKMTAAAAIDATATTFCLDTYPRPAQRDN